MNKVDPHLRFLLGQQRALRAAPHPMPMAAAEAFAAAPPEAASSPTVEVLLRCSGDVDALRALGLEVRAVAGDVIAGRIALDLIEDLAALPGVRSIEISRPMRRELRVSVPEIGADAAAQVLRGGGAGVIVGIIDSGIDVTHPAFRRPDGASRILAIWDQGLRADAGEAPPPGFGFGVEYRKEAIDAHLAGGRAIRHVDRDTRFGHGTHVASIAAGRASYVGVAPEADLVVVANVQASEALGTSANTLAAVHYIFTVAEALGRPAVINLSQGDDIGPHDGSSLLEQGIDNLLGPPGRAAVKSAGNAATLGCHAGGSVAASVITDVALEIGGLMTFAPIVDLWYSGADRISLAIRAPGGVVSRWIAPDESVTLELDSDNLVDVRSTLGAPENGDNRFYIQLLRGNAPYLQAGEWSLRLRGDVITHGRFDAWVTQSDGSPRFTGASADSGVTLSIPGTSREIITVGAYITEAAHFGALSPTSGRGPTRDRRLKPELCAPGQSIMAARASTASEGEGEAQRLAGTSMAAPHVSGTIALLLERDPRLTQREIRRLLTETARAEPSMGPLPDAAWGAGKLSALGAARVEATRPVEATNREPSSRRTRS